MQKGVTAPKQDQKKQSDDFDWPLQTRSTYSQVCYCYHSDWYNCDISYRLY